MKNKRIFGKSDLRNGMILEFVDGRRGMVLKDVKVLQARSLGKYADIIKFKDGFIFIEISLNEKLEGNTNKAYTVNKIYELENWVLQ